MTFTVKFTIGKEFIHCHGLAVPDCLVQECEQHLTNEQLVVVVVVSLHLAALSSDLHHTVVVCSVQLLQFLHQLVSLLG